MPIKHTYRRRSSLYGPASIAIAAALFLLISLAAAEKANNEIASVGCCEMVGDIDGNGALNVSDLTFLVAYMFGGGAAPDCPDEADLNADGSSNVADLTYLVDFLFRSGPAPAECPHLVTIIDLQPGDDSVHGTVRIPNPSAYRIVLWAKTDRWYVQPSTIDPFTPIQGNGHWSNYTNPWTRIVALLVDSTYVPGAVREEHPSSAPGVVDWDEYPEQSPDTYVDWSGYRWRVKKAVLTGPGPAAFSDDTANVRVDQDDRLHLKIDYRATTWYCAEIVLDHPTGYGVYTFQLDSRVDTLNYNAIFAGFIFDTTAEEFDMEFSQLLANPNNAQFVVQPWYLPGNIDFYDMPDTAQTSFSFEWRADHIVFTAWIGHAAAPTASTLIHTWTYTGANIPIPDEECMRFNLYLANGSPPTEGRGDEVVVTSFAYVP